MGIEIPSPRQPWCAIRARACVRACVLVKVSVEAPAGRDVFPRRLRVGPRVLSALQHLRPVGASVRRLLVRVVVHLGARLLPQVPVLRARLAHRRRRHAARRRRHVHQRAVTRPRRAPARDVTAADADHSRVSRRMQSPVADRDPCPHKSTSPQTASRSARPFLRAFRFGDGTCTNEL